MDKSPGEKFGLELISKQSELFRIIQENLSNLIRTNPIHSDLFGLRARIEKNFYLDLD